jgi:plastocyanin
VKTRVWILAAALMLTVVGRVTGGTGPGELHGTAHAGARPVMDAVVWLDAPNAPPPAVTKPAILDQRNLEFLPHVLVVRVGTRVKFPNNDRVFHNVFSFKDGKKFDLGFYPINAVKYVTFDRAGVSRLFCNIHPGMAAYVIAVDSPYFASSGASGAFTIEAPAGRYTYHAWRAGGPPLSGSARVDATTTLDVAWP